SAGAHGSISPSGGVAVNCGSDQAFTITPASCYQVADVQVDGSSRGAITSYTFTNVTANHTITASFALGNQTISASAGAHGSITPSGSITLTCGTDQTFTISAVSCYHVAGVQVDGSSRGPLTSYSFTNVTANHTITASFAVDQETVT